MPRFEAEGIQKKSKVSSQSVLVGWRSGCGGERLTVESA